MKVTRTVLAVALVLGLNSVGKATEWTIDPVHSSAEFKVKHLVISKVKGQFGTFQGTINFDGKDLTSGGAEVTIQTASVDTDNEDRDKHLRSADFFDVENFPTMTFKSTKVTQGEGNTFMLTGDLTIKGVTKSVTFDCVYHGAVEFMGSRKAGFSAHTTIDRTAFGLTWSRALETGGLVVGNDVEITLELELDEIK